MSVNGRQYEPPTVKEGSQCHFGDEPVLWPGVRGYAIRKGGRIYIPLIMAEKEGSGDVGRFLDALSARCIVRSVTSARLGGMLKRRGFKMKWVQTQGSLVDEWRREK
jgi:hypothetical protein